MRNTDFCHYTGLDNLPKIRLSSFPYFTLSDVEKIYCAINNRNPKGLKEFIQKAKEIATKVPSKKRDYMYQFMDETALFELFCETLPNQLNARGIDSWGRLMQFIS